MEMWGDLAARYVDFAAYADGDSACFADWARHVADDPEVLAWIGALPDARRQPNLVLAAARWHGVPAPGPYSALRDALLADGGAVRATILSRTTQTNEVRRLATLRPALVAATRGDDRPLALLEVGASAGLCLYPDRWRYRWDLTGGARSAGEPGVTVGDPGAPLLTCALDPGAPGGAGHGGLHAGPDGGLDAGLHGLLTGPLPPVVWRGGLDLNPLDAADPDTVAWLTTLVWPEHDDRRELLARAVEVARAEPPDVRRGDLLTDLPALVEEVGGEAQVVVVHSAVVAYLAEDDRRRFVAMMRELVGSGACRWVSNEGRGVLPEVTATGPELPPGRQTFVLGLDGQALAWTHGHGRSLEWCAPPGGPGA